MFNKKTIVAFSVILGLYAGFLLLPVLVSPVLNSHAKEIKELIKTSTGLNTELDKLSFVTSWDLSAGVKVKSLNLSIPGYETKPLLSANNIGVKLSLLPLVTGKLGLKEIFADNVSGSIIIKEDGNILLPEAPKKENELTEEAFVLPKFFKLSNKMPDIKLKNYDLGFVDGKTLNTYNISGNDFRVTKFTLNKRIKLVTKGKIVFKNSVISNYDIKADNKIMPDIDINEVVFPKEDLTKVTDNDKSSVTLPFNIINIFNAIEANKFTLNPSADVKIFGEAGKPRIKGFIKAEGISAVIDGKKLPESYCLTVFGGNETKTDAVFYTSSDKNEKTELKGIIAKGKNPGVNLNIKSNAKFNNVIRLLDAATQTVGITDLQTLSATGGMNADLTVNSDFKTVSSNGYLKILPSSVSYGLFGINISDISAEVDLTDNNININRAGFSIGGQPMNIKGQITSNADTDLLLTGNDLSIKGLLALVGQLAVLKENDISSGLLSLNLSLKGKLSELIPTIDSDIKNLTVYNKPTATKINLNLADVKIISDGKAAKGSIDLNSLVVKHPGVTVKIPQTNILADNKDITVKNSYLLINNSRIDIKGAIKDYISTKTSIDLSAKGSIESSDIASILPKDFTKLISYKGKMPVTIKANGNQKVQNIEFVLDADLNNYIALAEVNRLKNQNTKIRINAEIIGDSLTFSNSGISDGKTSTATLTGEVTKLYSAPKLNLSVSVPDEISFPIWGIPHSNITAQGTVNITGNPANPNIGGTVNIPDISMKDIDFTIKNLTVYPSGGILNGKANAKSFKFGGITASDLAADFSLKDLKEFYLNNITGKTFDGNIKGRMTYNIENFKTGLELVAKGLNSTKAVEGAVGIKNALTGTLNFRTKLVMRGLTDIEIIKSMNGDVNFEVENGRFVSIGRIENFINAQNIISNSILKSAVSSLGSVKTIEEADKFKHISGEIGLANGSANIKSIKVAGPLSSYFVKGTYDILKNTANLTILGRLDEKAVSALGPLGELSAEKLLSYIPKFGASTANFLKLLTSNPQGEAVSEIPELTGGSKNFKEFKVGFAGVATSVSSVKYFKWLSTCDTSKMNIKQEAQAAKDAIKTGITTEIDAVKTDAQNIKNNINDIVENQKNKVQTAKDNISQTKSELEKAKENAKNKLQSLKNSQPDVKSTETQTVPETPTNSAATVSEPSETSTSVTPVSTSTSTGSSSGSTSAETQNPTSVPAVATDEVKPETAAEE